MFILPRVVAMVFWLVTVFGCASKVEQNARSTIETEAKKTYETRIKQDSYDETGDLKTSARLADYLQFAALNNPGLEAAYCEWKAAIEKIPQARSLPDPKFTYTFYIRQVETRVGPQRHAFALSQTIPWYKKLALKGDVAALAAQAKHQQYESKKLELFYKVKKAYYEYYYLARIIAVTKDNILLVSSLESVAQLKFKSGAAPYASVVKAQMELGKLEEQLITLEQFRGPLTARLNAAMGRDFNKELPWPENVRKTEIAVDENQLHQWLLQSNPRLKALERETAGAQATQDLKGNEWVPDFNLGVKIIETGDAAMSGTEDSGKDAVLVSLGFNIPLWSRKYSSADDEAKVRVDIAQKKQEDAVNQLETDLEVALFNYREARRKMNLYRDTLLPKAEQSLAAFQTAYSVDKADFLDLIDATRALIEFSISYERALTNHLQRLAEIEMIVGREVPRAQNGKTGQANPNPGDSK